MLIALGCDGGREPKMFIIMLCKQPILVGTNIYTSLLTASRTEKNLAFYIPLVSQSVIL